MRRIIATFEDAEDRTAAKEALRDADLKPEEPDIDNPFFDPATKMPESRGLVWGGLLGGLLGVLLLFALEQNLFWIPRISPIMTAGFHELLFLGFGLGARRTHARLPGPGPVLPSCVLTGRDFRRETPDYLPAVSWP